MNIFLDTSALIKLYHKENGSFELYNLLKNNSSDLVIIVSDITQTEFHSAFMRRIRMNEISNSVAFSIFESLDSDMNYYYQVSVDLVVKNLATKLIDNFGKDRSIRTLDAFQLSAAIYCNQFIPIDIFITCDDKLIKMAGHYFTVMNPEEIA